MASADALSFAMISHSLSEVSSWAYPCFSRGLWCSMRKVARRWLVMRCSRRISSNNSLVSMGRSLKGLVVYTRMGASLILSSLAAGNRCYYGAQSSGGSRRDEAGSGGCAFGFNPAGCRIHNRSGLKAVLPYAYALADGSSYDCSTALSFDRRIGILRYGIDRRIGILRYDDNHSTYGSGAGVESTPPALLSTGVVGI